MSIFSPMMIYCCICKKEFDAINSGVGRKQRVCSMDCFHEYEHREVLSILGKEYTPRKKVSHD